MRDTSRLNFTFETSLSLTEINQFRFYNYLTVSHRVFILFYSNLAKLHQLRQQFPRLTLGGILHIRRKFKAPRNMYLYTLIDKIYKI